VKIIYGRCHRGSPGCEENGIPLFPNEITCRIIKYGNEKPPRGALRGGGSIHYLEMGAPRTSPDY